MTKYSICDAVGWSPVIKICVYSSLLKKKSPSCDFRKIKKTSLYQIFSHFFFKKYVIWYCDTCNCQQQMYVVKHNLMECFADFITGYEKHCMCLSTDVLNSKTFVARLLPHLCTVLIFMSLSISRIDHLSYSFRFLSCSCWTIRIKLSLPVQFHLNPFSDF
jgi:hypothetical protein